MSVMWHILEPVKSARGRSAVAVCHQILADLPTTTPPSLFSERYQGSGSKNR